MDTANPFVNRSVPLTKSPFPVLRTLILSLTLLPIRVFLLSLTLLFTFPFALCSGAADLCSGGLSRGALLRRSALRRVLLFPVRVAARLTLFFLGFHWIVTRGELVTEKERAPIIVPNHRSFLEPLYFAFRLLPCPVAKAEVARIPVIGFILRALQPILVARESKESRARCMEDIAARARDETAPQIVIYPEGTCTSGTSIISFKNGAFVPAVPVQPVAVSFPFRELDPSWVPIGPSLGMIVFRLLTSFHNSMTVTFLPVIEPTLAEKSDPALFAARARSSIAASLGVPCTRHSFTDVLLAHHARALHADPSKTNLGADGAGKIEQLFCSLSVAEAKRLLEKFVQIDADGSGEINEAEFAAGLDLPLNEHTRSLFHLMDQDGDGSLSFREFLSAMLMISEENKDHAQVVDSIFLLLGDLGSVNREAFNRALKRVAPEATNEQLQHLFDKIDTSHDQEISKQEMTAFFESNPEFLALFKVVVE